MLFLKAHSAFLLVISTPSPFFTGTDLTNQITCVICGHFAPGFFIYCVDINGEVMRTITEELGAGQYAVRPHHAGQAVCLNRPFKWDGSELKLMRDHQAVAVCFISAAPISTCWNNFTCSTASGLYSTPTKSVTLRPRRLQPLALFLLLLQTAWHAANYG